VADTPAGWVPGDANATSERCSSRRARCASRARPPNCCNSPRSFARCFSLVPHRSWQQTPWHHRVAVTNQAPPEHARRGGAGAPLTSAGAVTECRHVTKIFGGIRAVDDLTLALHEGEILGLIGHNGAGKTTLFDPVSGFLELDGGRILLGGMDMSTWPAHVRAVAGIGRTFQDARLFPSLSVEETIALALERHLHSRALVAAGLRLPAYLDCEADVAAQVQRLVSAMGLGAYAEKPVGEFVHRHAAHRGVGVRARPGPRLVLLDEPCGGVAQRETEELGPLIEQVKAHSGCAMLIIEHDMPLLRSVCDRMVALELGENIGEGPPDEVLTHEAVIRSCLGPDSRTIERSGAPAG
jgi:ABC-type branched-subunit amino acid transport system ATPase component